MSHNLFDGIPDELPKELIQTLCANDQVRIERIVSHAHASPAGFWYDQSEHEFVLLVQGRAGLRIAGREAVLVLAPGDYLLLPAHRKHRVEWTEPEVDTVWLAVFFRTRSGERPTKSG